MMGKTFRFALLAFMTMTVGLAVGQRRPQLDILTHWGEDAYLAAEQEMLELCATETNVDVNLRTVPFNDLYTTIVTSRTAGTSPDIYHLYNLWLPEFTGESGMLSAPPEEMVAEIVANAPQAVIDGVSVNDQVWGYPTEVNTYLLLYNKRLLQEAGYSAPPADWEELKEIAAAITRKDDTGAVSQVGFGVLPAWDSGVVHPFLTMLLSNGGEYLLEDLSGTAFNSEQGLETLQLYADLVANGGLDMSVSGWDFPNGKVGMVVMANWWRATLQASEAIDYDTEVGVAPVPVGPSGSESSTLSYNWLWSVDAGSRQQEAAWEFVRCLNVERQAGQGSPMGDYLVHALGAIPSMIYDQQAFAGDLGDFFLTAFVDSTGYARPEPIVRGGQEVKTIFQAQIEAVLTGLADPGSALQAAAEKGDQVLQEMQAQ
jgi:multiple sugar transport system substrate-binding protein